MSIEPVSGQGQTLGYPRGKVLGIVDTKAQFDDVVAALKKYHVPNAFQTGLLFLDRIERFEN